MTRVIQKKKENMQENGKNESKSLCACARAHTHTHTIKRMCYQE